MKAAICFLTWNRFEFTKTSLNSIIQNTNRNNYDIFVWDNGSSDTGMTQYLKNTCETNGFYYMFFKRNEGMTRAMNNQMKLMNRLNHYDAFCHIANDIIVCPNWLDGVFNAFKSNKVGAVGLKFEPTPLDTVFVDGIELEQIKPDGCLCGAHFCISKKIYDILGDFREVKLGYGQQDANYSLQIKLLPLDIDVYYLPKRLYNATHMGTLDGLYAEYQAEIIKKLHKSGSDGSGGRNYRQQLQSYRRLYDNNKCTKEELINLLKEKAHLEVDKSQMLETNIPAHLID